MVHTSKSSKDSKLDSSDKTKKTKKKTKEIKKTKKTNRNSRGKETLTYADHKYNKHCKAHGSHYFEMHGTKDSNRTRQMVDGTFDRSTFHRGGVRIVTILNNLLSKIRNLKSHVSMKTFKKNIGTLILILAT